MKRGLCCFTLKKTISTHTRAHTRNVVVPEPAVGSHVLTPTKPPGVMLSGFFFQHFHIFQNDLLFARDEIQEWLGLDL